MRRPGWSWRMLAAAWEATAGTVQQAVRAYEIAELRYREGVSTQLELADAGCCSCRQAHRARRPRATCRWRECGSRCCRNCRSTPQGHLRAGDPASVGRPAQQAAPAASSRRSGAARAARCQAEDSGDAGAERSGAETVRTYGNG